ncbi:hypothetical protein MILUP08_45127 [Micromonospora lupini str. Lupac 08]|uniref:Uncharacterized protein n=1 Tax=Micromonospora lupini str. Lupac 08 TaxID=1150864 RepID=I0L8V0_9ACTN|nr:hypothetical protein MILUP08_45127 [Micromonospora lupini str. Lupac 08]
MTVAADRLSCPRCLVPPPPGHHHRSARPTGPQRCTGRVGLSPGEGPAAPLLCFNRRNTSAVRVVRPLKQSKGRFEHPATRPAAHRPQRPPGRPGWPCRVADQGGRTGVDQVMLARNSL